MNLFSPTNLLLWLLAQGFAVSWAVDFLKRLFLVKRYPKPTAAVLNVLLLIVAELLLSTKGLPGGVLTFVAAVMTSLLASIGTHEVVPAPPPIAPPNAPFTSHPRER